ncbi:SDR family oxidoreductase [Streptomyces sp. NPDC004647]|uniref:SDR family NAD(P)-dependent oxidoreductase n=1 Tax=Streptomyces sp. NPDC004647 TaxID=3154671 RepID=UPI00339E07FF
MNAAHAESQTNEPATDVTDDAGPEPPEFDGKVALVTGASRGIGAATARLLAARGAQVVVNCRKGAEAAQEVVDSIRRRGGQAVALQGDVTDPEQVSALVAGATAELGPIDVLVLNAAGLGAHDFRIAPATELTWDDLELVVTQQLKALFLTTRAVLPDMVARGGGSVVAVGAALARRPSPGFLSLAIAKAGVEAAVRTLAMEVSPHGVRVNAVEPNLILTELSQYIPEAQRQAAAERAALRRNGTPEDVAEVIAFAASQRASYVTGGCLVTDGGTTMV